MVRELDDRSSFDEQRAERQLHHTYQMMYQQYPRLKQSCTVCCIAARFSSADELSQRADKGWVAVLSKGW